MKTSDEGVKLIQSFEGLRLMSYVCPAGVLTIGYGHTSAAGAPSVVPRMKVTVEEATKTLCADLGRFERGTESLVKVDITQNQFDALVSFAFNCGLGALKRSTLLKRVNAKRFDDVPAEFMKWNKAGGRALAGLTRRRRAEVEVWRSLPGGEPDSVIAAAQEVIPVIQNANSALAGSVEALGRPAVFIAIITVLACAGIWYWHKRRLDEEAS